MAQGLSSTYGTAEDEESRKVLRRAIEIGQTFWDRRVSFEYIVPCDSDGLRVFGSADIYGSGHK